MQIMACVEWKGNRLFCLSECKNFIFGVSEERVFSGPVNITLSLDPKKMEIASSFMFNVKSGHHQIV